MSGRNYDVHAAARALVAQSPRPMDLSEAYSILARRAADRRRSLGFVPAKRSTIEHAKTVETPTGGDSWRNLRLPYRDD